MTPRSSHLHVSLNISTLDDAERQSALAAIQSVAPASSLYAQSSAIQTGYAALVKLGNALKQGGDTVAADRQKLEADVTALVQVRASFDKQLRSLATLTETSASSASDLASMGFHARAAAVVASGPLAVPSSITVTLPKRHGGATRVSAVYDGGGRPHFAAQSSPDPVTATSWSTLAGAGRSRVLSGPSGTRVWVRFAAVRGGQQSDWSTAVLVTLP